MPQDIPLEASETLAFTPPCLKQALGEAAPSFTLGSPTRRDKRYIRRLMLRIGLKQHGQEAIRAEILNGLKARWDADTFERNSEMLKAYWEAIDTFRLVRKTDPDAVFEYDPDLMKACDELPGKIAGFWPALADMFADNADFAEMLDPIYIATICKGWSGLKRKPEFDAEHGYITVASAEAMLEELNRLALKHGADDEQAGTELALACFQRMNLDEDEAKNSASPSLSSEAPDHSKSTNGKAAGKSPASASSRKTRRAASKTLTTT